MNTSIPILDTMEYISSMSISPFISKGVCKVCWVGQNYNRNNTIITKEVAMEMGRKLPGSPVVGFYNKDTKDFEGHERELQIENGKINFVDLTKPYGFVPTDAKVWFQKFDDNGIEREYLVTDVYIWDKVYPESQRILNQGNNQSMELENTAGFWTNGNKTNARIFIYNEALIKKLCILGENVEPCFEGAQIKSHFSLENNEEFQKFKTEMFSMLEELQEILNNKGGSNEPMDDDKKLNPETATAESPESFAKKPEEDDDKKKQPSSEDGSESKTKEEPNSNGEKKENSEENDDKKKKYNLEEVVEYTELLEQYNKLQNQFSELQNAKTALDSELNSLREFKMAAEREKKQAMIDSFYMLGDTDKQDVIEHIDTYSLDDIEAKLSIICVRNKVNFSLNDSKEDNNNNDNPQGLFNLNNVENDNAPDWIKAIRQTAKSSN